MKEHAIPQDITGYKFHIVGNMTLKQFAEVAIGAVVAFFIFKTNLFPLIKYPLVLFSAGFGAALAFLPFEERPLDHWLVTFVTILYKPTKFYWKKKSKVPEPFLYEASKTLKTQVDELDLTPQRRQRITEYIQSVKTPQPTDELEVWEKQRSSQLLSIFDDKTLRITSSDTTKILQKPDLKVKVRSLIGVEDKSPEEEIVVQPQQPQPQVVFSRQTYQQAAPRKIKQTQEYVPVEKKVISTDQVASEIEIPEIENIEISPEEQAQKEALSQFNNGTNTQEAIFSTQSETHAPPVQAKTATRNENLPFPVKPSKPNKIVGMILTQNNDLVDGATLTIKDESGNTVSAIQSNALGQFFITSQLNNGTYTIFINKDDLTFSPVQITLNNSIIEPLEIRSDG